ncbi:hypothetical protein [Flavobacterium aquicola]|uniref:Uncharacterized protein n=1 Tax=Flavobacterium aquicola TaxID=1682742 RepID=A0A3E0DWK6_9FLAO|nr:hypothetical protein [Flavobacterium aquicola]REG90462.1 hypothetical protein C8P67_1211 [Flavobacterium aquicola]
MKFNKIIYPIIASFLLVFTACESIVEEDHLSNTNTVEGVQLKAENTTQGGNEIKIEMLTPGITGHFNYIIGKALTDRATILFPVMGTFNFTYKGSLGAELFEKKVAVTIDKLDHPVPPEWGALLGTDAVAGKTWIFDQNGTPDNLWWFMSAPNNPAGSMGAWWNAGGTCCPPSDANGKMHFDLNGDANYVHYENTSATGTKGTFILNPEGKTLTINDSKMLGYAAGNKDGVYTIVSLTANKMVLYLNNNETNGTGWTFVFRPE